jgi:hypothetical protein
MKTIAEMKNDIVRLYGLENENTIHFFEICEKFKFGKKLIYGTYNLLIKKYTEED